MSIISILSLGISHILTPSFTLSLSLPLSFPLSLFLSLSFLSFSLSLFLSFSLSLFLFSLSLSFSLSFFLSFSLSLFLSLFLSLSFFSLFLFSLSFSLFLFSLSLSFSLSFSLITHSLIHSHTLTLSHTPSLLLLLLFHFMENVLTNLFSLHAVTFYLQLFNIVVLLSRITNSTFDVFQLPCLMGTTFPACSLINTIPASCS